MLQQKAKNKSCLPSLPEQKKQKKKVILKYIPGTKQATAEKNSTLGEARTTDLWAQGRKLYR